MVLKRKHIPPTLLCFVIFFCATTQLYATTFTDPVFGWQLQLPGQWKIEVNQQTEDSISGKPARGWLLSQNPMNYIAYQVEEYDVRNSIRYDEYKNKYFESISASMLVSAQKAGAEKGSNIQQVTVGGHIFDALTWVLQAPGRPVWKSMTLVAPMTDKALSIGISCTAEICDEVFAAIDSSKFSNPDGQGPVTPAPPPLPPQAMNKAPVWDFTIPIGWTRVATTSPEDKLAIEKGDGNSLTYSLIEDESQELSSLTINDLKAELFKETVSQFQQIAHENNLLFTSEEEVSPLGKHTFHTISIGLLNQDTQEPVMVAAQAIAIINNRLAMIMITCTDEQSCNEVQKAVEDSSFL